MTRAQLAKRAFEKQANALADIRDAEVRAALEAYTRGLEKAATRYDAILKGGGQ